MDNRTSFPPVFWVANLIEVLERFAYYGIYFGFGIYMEHLGYSRGQLGIIPSVLFVLSVTARTVPEINGLKMPAANPMLNIVRAMPEKDLVRISSMTDGR